MRFLVFFALLCASLPAQEKKPDAAELVKSVRRSQAERSYDLIGQLSKDRKKIPFKMSVIKEHDTIRFHFTKPAQVITLELKNNRNRLSEVLPGQGSKELDPKRYGENIRGTDLTYEDISQRFLYWPDPKIIGEERIRITLAHDCWKLKLVNPRRDLGPYSGVWAWISKENHALLKLEAFDWNKKKVKRFEVQRVMKDKEMGTWLMEKMKIETIDHKRGKSPQTYMTLEKPKKRK